MGYDGGDKLDNDMILIGFLMILVVVSTVVAILSVLVIINPNECGVLFYFGKPKKILRPGMSLKSSYYQVKKIRMDGNTWRTELDQIKNQNPDMYGEVDTFIMGAKRIYGTRLKETKCKYIAVICDKCNNRIEVNLDDYKSE
jgi:hypothetical protein